MLVLPGALDQLSSHIGVTGPRLWAQRVVEGHVDRHDAIHAEGQGVKNQLDALEADARALHHVAHPPEVLDHFEDYDQRLLEVFDRQLHAVDTYLALAHGQPVNSSDLANAIGDLTDIAQHAPYHSLDSNPISRTEWEQLLEPVTQLLRDQGIEPDLDQHLERRHPGPELGL